jgi:hypothetical protein
MATRITKKRFGNKLNGRLPDWEQRRLVMKLRSQGKSFAEVGAVLGITKQSAHGIWWAAMNDLGAEFKEEAKVIFDLVYLRSVERIARMNQIEESVCSRCLGLQRVPAECDEEGNYPWGADGEGRIICPHCKGSGYQYGATTRIEATRTSQREDELVARIFGLDKIAGQIEAARYDFAAEIMAMSDEDIDREYEALMAPLGASAEAWEQAKEQAR